MAVLSTLLHGYETLTRSRLVDTTDGYLLERFCSGDEDAFALLVRRHGPLVFGVCRRELGHEQDAEDVFQATFLVLARKASARRWQSSVAGWLFETAYRLTREARRRNVRRMRREQLPRKLPVSTPEAEALRREMGAVLDEELVRLPERYRTTLVLCLLEGRSRDEAASLIGCPLRTVKYRLERGRELLRERLARRGWALSTVLGFAALATDRAHAVPEALVASAASWAVGKVLEPAGHVAALARAIEGSAPVRLKLLGAVVLLAGVAIGVAGATFQGEDPARGGQPETPIDSRPAPPRAEPVGMDAELPLPERVLLRFGTTRFRHPNGIQALALSPDGGTVVSFGGGTRTFLQINDAQTGRVRRVIPTPHTTSGLEWGTRRIAIATDGTTVAVAGDDGVARRYDVESGKEVGETQTRLARCDAVAFSPDGAVLFTSEKARNSSVKAWDLATGKELWEARKSCLFLLPSSDSRFVIAADRAQEEITILVQLDARTGKEVNRFPHGSRVTAAALAADGRRLAAACEDQQVHLWDVARGAKIRSLTVHLDVKQKHLNTLAFSPDGKTLAVGATDANIHLWDVATGKAGKVLRGHGWWVTGLQFTRDGKTLYSGSWDSTIRRWDVASGKEHDSPEGLTSGVRTAMTRDRRLFALASTAGAPEVSLHDGEGRRVGQISPLDSNVNSMRFSPDDARLATAHYDGSVRLWTAEGKPLRALAAGQGERVLHTDLKFSPDGRQLAVVVSTGHAVRVFSLKDGKETRLQHKDVVCLAWSRDGAHLLTGGWDHRIRLWEVAGAKEIAAIDTGDIVDDLVYAPDGRTFASSHHSLPIQLWETSSRTVIRKLEGHKEAVFTIAFTPDGLWLLSGGVDRTLRVWDVATGRQVDQLDGHRGWISDIQTDLLGQSVLTGSLDTTALLWSLRPKTEPLENTDPETLWKRLQHGDPKVVHRTYWQLIDNPDVSVPLIARHLEPAKPTLTADRVQRLIAKLDSDSFEEREAATEMLKPLARMIEPTLKAALDKSTSAEKSRRLGIILAEIDHETPEDVLQKRACAILEKIATPEADGLLKKLASGAPDAPLTLRARRALERANASR